MKKSFASRLAACVLAVALILGIAAVPAFAACPDPGVVYAQQSPCIIYRLPLNAAAARVVNEKTLDVSGIVDALGRPVIATRSTDGHFYIVPTSQGNIYIGTGC